MTPTANGKSHYRSVSELDSLPGPCHRPNFRNDVYRERWWPRLHSLWQVSPMRLKWLLCLALASSGLGQKSSPPLASGDMADALKSATLPLSVTTQGDLARAGGKLITDAIERARFVLLGESHFSRETPQLAAAICKAMHPDAYAVEAGPYAAAYVESILKSPNRKLAMEERERMHPANMAFLDNEQENDLAAKCVSRGGKDVALWGLDQEFLGAASMLLQQMQQEPNGPKSLGAIQLALEEDKQAELRARQTGDFMQLFLVSASDADINSLQKALAADGTQKSQEIMRELTESRHIYRLNAAGSAESNSARASLLKRHFLVNYRALQERTPAPHVLLKFGDNHIWKGFNDLHQLDLGNYVAELASVEQATSLHIQVIAAKGTLAGLGNYARPTTKESFVLADVPEYAWLKPVVDLLPAESNGSMGVVLDLRRLRFRQLEMSPEWLHLVYGYDLLVVLPVFTPANLYD